MRMMSRSYVDAAHNECPYGCCRVSETMKKGARQDHTTRRRRRKTEKAQWRRELVTD
jgi:hypothetical protein